MVTMLNALPFLSEAGRVSFMGLAKELEEQIIHAAKRTPWLLELLTAENLGETLNKELRREGAESPDKKLQTVLINIIDAQTGAIIRLGKEVEALQEAHDAD
jgi:uncharacterized FlaG/YvyC family protein